VQVSIPIPTQHPVEGFHCANAVRLTVGTT
jgi:hypothetical protein